MRSMIQAFLINGRPMLAPDGEVAVSYEDIDAADAGRDHAGFMHRSVVRSKVPSWNFSYSYLTEEEKNYMEDLFGEESTFLFTHPSRQNSAIPEQTLCYRSKYGISWKNARSGLWSGYSFTVIAC